MALCSPICAEVLGCQSPAGDFVVPLIPLNKGAVPQDMRVVSLPQ